jgi:colicin import membrane protein
MWKELQDSDSPEDFEDFLAAFPESKLAPVARIKLKRLKRKQAKAQAEEKQLAEEAKKLEAERQRLEAEKQQLAEAKRKAEEEQKRKQEEERKSQLAEEAKRLEEERQRLEAEKQQIAEAKQKAEEEQKRKQEKEQKRQLAEEAKREEEERKRQEAEQRRIAEANVREAYESAKRKNTAEAYRTFLSQFRNDDAAWHYVGRAERQLKQLDDVGIRKDEVTTPSLSGSASRATKRQAYLDYLEAKGANTATALRQFIGKYSNTSEAKSYVERAQKELRQLE